MNAPNIDYLLPADIVKRLRNYDSCTDRDLDEAADEIEKLRSLIGHCWVHSGYPNCGFDKMDSDMRALYTSVISADVE